MHQTPPDEATAEWLADVRALGLPLLSVSQERALGVRIAQGDPAALDELVTHNLRLVPKLAARYRREGMPLADLIQEGNIGLMRAAHKFDPSLGHRFSTYATWWIRQAISRACRENGRLVHIPGYLQTRAYADQLAALPTAQPLISLDMASPWAEPGSVHETPITLGEMIPDNSASADIEGRVDRRADREHLAGLFTSAHLPARDRQVLLLRYGGATLDTIGRRIGCSRERVRQIETRALDRLRQAAGVGAAGV